MKYLFGIFLCLVMVSAATAQQNGQSKPLRQVPAPAIKPTAEALMKAQMVADQSQSNREEISVEELRKMIEREFAKSASTPIVTSIQELDAQMVLPIAIPEIRGASERSATAGENAEKIEQAKEKITTRAEAATSKPDHNKNR